MKNNCFGSIAGFLLFVCLSGQASASTIPAVEWDILGDQLVGARNIQVLGAVYEVAFFGGTCSEVYMGCSDPTDFTFYNSTSFSIEAKTAAEALKTQVFVNVPEGDFRSSPLRLSACCRAMRTLTPYAISTSDGHTLAWMAESDQAGVSLTGAPLGSNFGEASNTSLRWARWTPSPVPIPSTAWLMVAGLIILIALGKMKKKPCR